MKARFFAALFITFFLSGCGTEATSYIYVTIFGVKSLLVIQRIQTPMAARPALMLATHVLRLLRLLAGKLLTGVIRATIAHRVSRVSNRSIR